MAEFWLLAIGIGLGLGLIAYVLSRDSMAALAEDGPKGPWWVPLATALVPLVTALGVAILAEVFEKPDCTTFVSTLLDIHKSAGTGLAASGAVEHLTWGGLQDECGNAVEFLKALGDAPAE